MYKPRGIYFWRVFKTDILVFLYQCLSSRDDVTASEGERWRQDGATELMWG